MWSPVWIWESEIPHNICDQIINLYYDFGEKYGLDCRDAKAD